ncbi:ApeA N-terminal domain 1-containing protein [Hamadaea tsunoensis]|uniref:ApeA N-terminal domain 1-containing protein n=1 Tax=Hamadaea tsunoensis TaxID=53368 RepID=UPI00146FC55D|nr:HEPN domain-containing protein [Hamadaea tsunoensis]
MASGNDIPLKVKLDPGEYRVTWYLPDDGRPEVAVTGDLELRGNGYPLGRMYGSEVPVEWKVGDGGSSAGFPQRKFYERLRGKLVSGLDVILLSVEVEIWTHDQAILIPRAALVGMGIGKLEDLVFDWIKVQVTAQDVVAGVAPLKSITFPSGANLRHLEGTWTVEGNPDSSQEWDDETAKFRLEYDGSATIGDPYRHRMAFSPVAVVELASPATFDECIRDWVTPLHRVISLASGHSERLTYLLLGIAGQEGDDKRARRVQVYGNGIYQEPYASRYEDIARADPAFRVKIDGIPLLSLVQEWRNLELQQHPFMETFGSALIVPDLHPRSRYLLLIQAFEGLHGYQNSAEEELRREHHAQKRALVLGAIRLSLYKEGRRFLDKYLMKTPPGSLDARLRQIFADLPNNPTDELKALPLIQAMFGDARRPTDVGHALRLIRNDLSHGSKNYDAREVNEVVIVLHRVARAHLLRLLGCDDAALRAVLQPRD